MHCRTGVPEHWSKYCPSISMSMRVKFIWFYYFVVVQGRVIFSSGSPFPPVTINGKTYKPGQGNNAYIFPGVALGVIATLMHHIPDDVFLIAARELAASVRDEDLEMGSLYPPLDSIREVSLKIAIGITKYAYLRGKQSTWKQKQIPFSHREMTSRDTKSPVYTVQWPIEQSIESIDIIRSHHHPSRQCFIHWEWNARWLYGRRCES